MKKSIIVIIVVVLIATGLFLYFRPANQVKVLEVETARVEKGSLSKIVSASGSIQPERMISLNAGEGDIVEEILKKAGDEVKGEDILIKFKNGYELKSPIEGVVLEMKAVEGEKVGTAFAAPTSLTTPSSLGIQTKTSSMAATSVIVIADFDPLIVEAEVEETEIIDIVKGQETKITLEAYPGKELSGKVIEVGISSTQAMLGGTPAYLVKIEIQDSQGIYPRAGFSCDLEIEVETKEDILYIPYEAIFEEENKHFVFRAEGEIAQKTEVKIGLETEDYYEIVSGLEKGDIVIISDLDEVVEGQKVRIK